MFLVFDTETTGLPKIENAPLTDFDNWPRMVQLAWQIHDEKGRFVENHNYLVQPDGFVIPIDAKMVHGISTEHAMKYGKPLNEVLDLFMISAAKAKYLVGHNINFDLNVLGCEFLRCGRENPLRRWQIIDTCTEKTAEFCQGGRSRQLASNAAIVNREVIYRIVNSFKIGLLLGFFVEAFKVGS